MAIKHVTKGSIFDDLKFSDDEAQELKKLAEVVRTLENCLTRDCLTQQEKEVIKQFIDGLGNLDHHI